MNNAAADLTPSVTTKFEPVLDTAPVGAFGTLTVSGGLLPSARYRVLTSVPLSATHQGEVGRDVSPQALTRFGSTLAATPGWSDTRFVTVKRLSSLDDAAAEATSAAVTRIAAATATAAPER